MNIVTQENSYKKQTLTEEKYLFRPADRWGFFTNLRHPTVRKEYEAFHLKRKIPPSFPLSDEERHEFDSYILQKYPAEWECYLFENGIEKGA